MKNSLRNRGTALPTNLELTNEEQHELAALSNIPFGKEPTIASYWKQLFSRKGIIIPHDRIPVCVATRIPGEYVLEWHPRALGPKAIAAGAAFRQHAEVMAKEFEARMVREGRSLWQ